MDLTSTSRALIGAVESAMETPQAVRDYVEEITFATADEIMAMLHNVLSEDVGALPVWSRNLAYRLACLQRPDDPKLLREAAVDLRMYGPDWDEIADELDAQADELDQPE